MPSSLQQQDKLYRKKKKNHTTNPWLSKNIKSGTKVDLSFLLFHSMATMWITLRKTVGWAIILLRRPRIIERHVDILWSKETQVLVPDLARAAGLQQSESPPDLCVCKMLFNHQCSEDMRLVRNWSNIYLGDYGTKESVIIWTHVHFSQGQNTCDTETEGTTYTFMIFIHSWSW